MNHTEVQIDDPSKLYWMKLYTSFFDKHEIKILWKTNRDFVLLYIRLILESIPNRGVLKYNSDIAYTYEDIALLFDLEVDIVRSGIECLASKGMVIVEADGTMRIPFATKCLETESVWASIKRKQRSNEKLENGWRRLNGNLMVSADGKRKVTIDEQECGGHGMTAVAQADGKCQHCGRQRGIVVVGGVGELTEPNALKVLCKECAANELAQRKTGVEVAKLKSHKNRRPPDDFSEVVKYLEQEEQFIIVNRMALEAKFNELRNRGWKDGNGRAIRDWKNFFMGMAARHLTKAVSLAKEEMPSGKNHAA